MEGTFILISSLRTFFQSGLQVKLKVAVVLQNIVSKLMLNLQIVSLPGVGGADEGRGGDGGGGGDDAGGVAEAGADEGGLGGLGGEVVGAGGGHGRGVKGDDGTSNVLQVTIAMGAIV